MAPAETPPWQLTKKRFVSECLMRYATGHGSGIMAVADFARCAAVAHQFHVEEAIRRDDDVPAHIRAEYEGQL